MTEQVPSGLSVLEKERARLASERAKLDHKEDVLNREELFGKFDNGVTPAEGEMTYQQYLEQRPAEAVILGSNGKPRGASSNHFATAESYKAQTEDIQDHYARVGNLVNKGEYQPPNYENMGVVQLAKEASKARALGDRAAEAEVRAAVEHHLTMDAMKDDSETPEEAQARYDGEITRYDLLVERFEDLSAAAKIEKVTPEPVVEATPVESAPEEVSSVESEPEAKAPAGVLYNGEKVTVDNVFQSPDGKKAVQIVDAEGKSRLVFEEELTYVKPEPVVEKVEDTPVVPEEPVEPVAPRTPTFVVDSSGEASVVGQTQEDPAKGKELVPFVGAQGRELVVVEEDEAEKATRLDRIKNWFKKERSHYQEFGGAGYWGKKWDQALNGVKTGVTNVVNIGVTEEMSDQEKDQKRKRNRIVMLVGVGVLGATAAGLIIHGAVSAHDVHSSASGGEMPTPSPVGRAAAPAGVENLPLTGAGIPGAETVSASPELSSIPVESFNIPRGLGGEQLFTNLGIDPSKWYNNENSLLSQFPADLYRMSDGHVGISHTGMLSQGLQKAIDLLKSLK